MLILFRSVNKHGYHRQLLFLIGWFLKKSFLKSSSQINQNVVGSTYGRFCIKFPEIRMKGERHRLNPLSLKFYKAISLSQRWPLNGLTVCWKSDICIQIPFYLLNNSHTSIYQISNINFYSDLYSQTLLSHQVWKYGHRHNVYKWLSK